MPKVSINILTKNRPQALQKALLSIDKQSFKDYEIILIDDGSVPPLTPPLIKGGAGGVKIINHKTSLGITLSRQEALQVSGGEYIAILDDDDEWIDIEKLKKQVEFLDNHSDYVLVGGGIQIISNAELLISKQIQNQKSTNIKFRPKEDDQIRKTMLFRNNFFTSTVMFRRETALQAGGFKSDGVDLAEDYDLWLRLGQLGKMYNFSEVFTNYTQNRYNKDKFRQFLKKQGLLIRKHCKQYPYFILSKLIISLRLLF